LHARLALVDQSLAGHLVLVVSLPLVVSGKSFFAGGPFQMSINGNKRKARFFQKSNFAFLWSLHVLYTSANDQFFHRVGKSFALLAPPDLALTDCDCYQPVQKRLVRRVRARGLQDFLGDRHTL